MMAADVTRKARLFARAEHQFRELWRCGLGTAHHEIWRIIITVTVPNLNELVERRHRRRQQLVEGTSFFLKWRGDCTVNGHDPSGVCRAT